MLLKGEQRDHVLDERLTIENNKTLLNERDFDQTISITKNTCPPSSSPSNSWGFCRKSKKITAIFGLIQLLTGLLIAVGHFSFQQTTTSIQYVEGTIPSYLTSSMTMLSGLLAIIASRKRVKLLVVCVVFLSIVSTLFCFASFVYLLADVNSNLDKLHDCTFSAHERTCKCFVTQEQGSESARKLLKFSAVQSCLSVKKNLRSLVYGVSVLFGVGFVISMVTAVASSYLLFAQRRKIQQRNLPLTNAEAPILMTSITTQTQESCLQTRPRPCVTADAETQGAGAACGAANLSVGTQTPIYMMPVAQLVYDISNEAAEREYRMLSVTSSDRDEPPPPYCDAVTS
eukprot:gene6497-7243_t